MAAKKRGRLWNVVCLLISAIIGAFATLVTTYMSGFFTNFFVPISVDHRPTWHDPPCIGGFPVINNLILLSLFVVQHSTMQRGPLKKLQTLLIPEDFHRPLYSLVTTLIMVAIGVLWQPMPTVVWEVTNDTLRIAVIGINGLCWVAYVFSLLSLDPLSLLGIKEPLYRVMEWDTEKVVKLVDTGIYGLSRHPVYCAILLAMWITPRMTVGHLLLSTVSTVYTVLAAIYYEEPDLVKVFGESYVKYQQKTPMFFPTPFHTRATETKKD